MKPTNLISAYQGMQAILASDAPNHLKKPIKKREVRSLEQLCNLLISNKATFQDFDGFFVNYTIRQISKEFDLLRFGEDAIIDIELKSELTSMEEIAAQMKQNLYYLNFLQKPIKVYTFVENDALLHNYGLFSSGFAWNLIRHLRHGRAGHSPEHC